MKSGVYKFSWPNNQWFYIGSSFWIEKRWREHKNDINIGRHWNPKLKNVWLKYGEPIKTVLELTDNWLEVEQKYLDLHFDDPYCLNISPFANSPTMKLYEVPDLVNLYTGETFKSTKISPGELTYKLNLSRTHHVSEFIAGKKESVGGWVRTDTDLSKTKHFKHFGKVLTHDLHGDVKVIKIADAVKEINMFDNYNQETIKTGVYKVLTGVAKNVCGWRVKCC
jgi:group I intron endonuclease